MLLNGEMLYWFGYDIKYDLFYILYIVVFNG